MMKALLRCLFVTALGIFVLSASSDAQLLNCDKLQKLVKVVAEDSTLNAIKGDVRDDTGSDYVALISLWYVADDDHFQDILFDKTGHRFFYHTEFINKGDGRKEFSEIAKTMQTCLGSSWTLTLKDTGYDGSQHIFRNIDNNVVVNLYNDGGVICISCYATAKK